MIGDAAQLPSIGAGGMFDRLTQLAPAPQAGAAVVFAFHDNQTIRPSTVKGILCRQVGLAGQDAFTLL